LRLGDVTTACKKCGKEGVIIESLPAMKWQGIPTVLDGAEVRCGCPSGTNRLIAPVEQPSRAGSTDPIREASQPASAAQSNPINSGATVRPTQTCVFAKSCVSVPAGSTDAGAAPEPAANFGATALLASMGTAGTLGRVAGTLGSDLGAWAVRGLTEMAAGASSTLGVVLLAMWPRDIGDATLYTPEQLASMRSASTRVRFQFRRDAAGDMQVYGLHTRPDSGTDRVPVTQARWNANKSAMVAELDGISITWTPNNGPVVNVPSPYPGTPERLDNLLVHPIPWGQETRLTHYPGQDAEDLTWLDTIITFPADSGVPPLYLVFAKPALKPLEVGTYGSFIGRLRNGLEADHMPSKAALEHYLIKNYPHLDEADRKQAMKNVASIAVPAHIHRKKSETYGWRNTETKQLLDAGNLRGAVESNFNAIRPYLLEERFSEADLDGALSKMHKINEEQGWY